MRLAIDHDLEISDAEFVSWWNSDEDCLKFGMARPGSDIDDLAIDVAHATVVVLQAVGYGVAGNYAYDLIRERFRKRSKTIEFVEIRRPDGEVITRIKSTSDE